MSSPLMIVVGASWGGVDALQLLLAALPEKFPAVVLLVLHRGEGVPDVLESVLQRSSTMKVADVEDKEAYVSGRVYVAPAGYHVLVDGDHFCLTVDEPVQHARPSIDVSMIAAAEALGPRVVGVLLTGAGRDGAEGLAEIKRRGGWAIIQEPSTAARASMPLAALELVTPDRILPLEHISTYLVELVMGAA